MKKMATKRKDGRWMARKVVNGKRITAYGRSEREANMELERLLPSAAPVQLGTRPTVHEIAEAIWLPRVRGLSPETQRRYTDLYIRHVRDFLGFLMVDGIGPRTVKAWLDELDTRGVTPNTRLLSRGILKQLLDEAIRLEFIDRNAADKITVSCPKNRREKALSLEMAQNALDALRGLELAAPVYLAMVLGLRRGEICALEWSDLDRQQKTLRIDKQRQITFKVPGLRDQQREYTRAPKAGSIRTLRLLPWIIDGIDARGVLDSKWICTKRGEQWRPATLTEYWANERVRLGLSDWHFHDLRHAAAGLLLAGGCTLFEVGAVLGQKNIKTTELYLQQAEAYRHSAADKMQILR